MRTVTRAYWQALRTGRATAVAGSVGALAFASVLMGVTAAAQPSPSPTGYEPEPEPEIALSILEPICDNDVPYLSYSIDATNFVPTNVSLTWINPGGSDVVQSGLPLEGRVLWPGAEVDAEGNPLDWPGWSFVDGEWVEGDEFDWVRPSVEVLFEVNPEVSMTVDYPPSSPVCDANPPAGEQPPGEQAPAPPRSEDQPAPAPAGALPDTGASVSWPWFAAGAGGLLLVGTGLLVGSRRSRGTS